MSEAITKKTKRPAMHLRPPFPCCYAQHRPTSVATAWLFQCQLMTMQFVMLKPLLTALPFILRLIKQLDYDNRPPILNGQINPYSPKLYIQVSNKIIMRLIYSDILPTIFRIYLYLKCTKILYYTTLHYTLLYSTMPHCNVMMLWNVM